MSASATAEAVPVLVLGESRRSRLLERAAAVVHAWHAEWGSEGVGAPAVEICESGTDPAAGRGKVALAALVEGKPLLQAFADADFVRALCAGSRESPLPSLATVRGGLEGALTCEILHALCLDLVRAAMPSAACSVTRDCPSLVRTRAAGRHAIGLTIRAGRPAAGCSLQISLASALVDALLGQRPNAPAAESLVARRRAAQDQHVSLTVTLGTASVSWRDLRSLCVGDAIVLEQPLEAPCTLSVNGSAAVADAHLGRADTSLAVQIARVNAAPQRKRGQT